MAAGPASDALLAFPPFQSPAVPPRLPARGLPGPLLFASPRLFTPLRLAQRPAHTTAVRSSTPHGVPKSCPLIKVQTEAFLLGSLAWLPDHVSV